MKDETDCLEPVHMSALLYLVIPWHGHTIRRRVGEESDVVHVASVYRESRGVDAKNRHRGGR